MKVGVVIHKQLLKTILDPVDAARLEAIADVRWTQSETAVSVARAVELLADCEIGMGSWGTPYPCREIMEGCPKLKLWEHAAGTVRHMFGEHLRGRDLMIASCHTAIADDVAELAFAYIVLGMRRAVQKHLAANRGVQLPGRVATLFRHRVGIIGVGAVARRVIPLLVGFGAEVLAYDPYLDESEADSLGVGKATIEDIFKTCEVVSLHTPHNERTTGMIRREHFRLMPDGAAFVNTARGACVDEEALIEELSTGRIFAFLDVTWPEPAAEESPLRSLDNVFLTPHIAGPASFRLGKQAVDDIESFTAGGRPMKVVTADMLDHIA